MFAAVAEARSFRVAAERLGVTRSAVSQSISRLEGRIGAVLLRRMTRSVALTDVGERFHEALKPALAEIATATRAAGDAAGDPRGTLRLAVSSIAERFLSGPILAAFLDAHPAIRLDIVVSDATLDIVAAGFDAGVRLGEVIERDMVAVPVSGAQRQLVVAAPAYLARRGAPDHPRVLPEHDCIGWRPAADVAPYRWEFSEDGRDFDVAVDPRVATNDMGVMLRLARCGAGLTCGMEETFRPDLDRGDLVAVLERFCPPFPGFLLFHPARRHASPALQALIDHLRRTRRSAAAFDSSGRFV